MSGEVAPRRLRRGSRVVRGVTWLLPRAIDRRIAAALTVGAPDFALPAGEPSLVPPDAVSWRVFRNPVTMYVGGVVAVLLELGEPRVRHGVWDHSGFRRDPAGRLRRTGTAAMVTVYGAHSTLAALAGRVARMHARVEGTTPDGQPYAASDPELLRWVQATAAWAFAEAYRSYAAPLCSADLDLYYGEGTAGAKLYGVIDPPADAAAMARLFAETAPRLTRSPILHELLAILRRAPILPAALRPLQHVVVAAAVALLPPDLRTRLGLDDEPRVRLTERWLLTGLARAAERTHVRGAPYALASRRMGLPDDYVLTAAAARPRS